MSAPPPLHVLLLQGPNLAFLGRRQPELYGTTSAAELDAMCQEHAARNGYRLSIFYTNSEGAALDRIYQAFEEGLGGLVMNPGAWSHAGHSLRHCLQGVAVPYVEVHLRNQYKMGLTSNLADLASGVIQGLGLHSYLLGLDAMLRLCRASTVKPDES